MAAAIPASIDEKFQSLLKSLLPIDDLYEKGRQRARLSCAEKRLPEDLQILEDYARAAALDVHTEPYDPNQNEQDRLREAYYKKRLDDRAESEKALMDVARPRVRDQEAILAALRKNLVQPKLSQVIMIAAVLVISLSVAPTLHDRFFLDLDDPLLAWAISTAGAAFVATFITWSLVGAVATTGKRSITNIGGLVAGIGISVATGILRITEAQTWNEYVFAIALTLVEAFTVVFLEWHAIGLRSNYRQWFEYQQELAKGTAELEAAQADCSRWEEGLAGINKDINSHISYVEERWIRHHKVADLELLAVKAIIDGYDQGIAEVKGRRLGLVLVK